ncbi:30S ribosomal protein S15, partial [Patescibacteria group bacterium]|nr:30S ribosomal protein S15 [Patescibacteria group bacterium]
LSQRIQELTTHLSIHKKDNHSRRGLLRMVGTRRKLLNYLKKHKNDKYLALVSTLGLKK